MSEKRDTNLYLKDILESIERIEKYTHSLSEREFNKDFNTQDAIVHRLEIIGESIKNIPQEIQEKYREIPWREIARTRDKIVHHYFDVDLEQIWSIIKNDLHPLKKQIKNLLSELESKR